MFKDSVLLNDWQVIAAADNVAAGTVQSIRLLEHDLDLQRECHFPSDKASLAYRRWLKQKGVTFGTIP
ncbi:hypothetical protein MC7420_5215 [Coleofasciculus chthonoplastes PCC 7420]|uniref:Uncharacterized protein n=1 Tax=Coleofasciculus chthonoplastes PCC 7420 TaxID=118168 RepID=B4W2L0_9CYAN|nr:hypothetical protein [Coleofasciculus chthonoplastes]EDX71590.1 hypothetical protein MC7420_5215 [Coleofasciculus chthonoplastes PCC 7420]